MIPDAVTAVIAAVMTRHPAASPEVLARLVVAELRTLGWHITPKPHPPVHQTAA
ncbi:hypothetical protein [Streptomyces sp. NPDC002564]|uniref:hypothetical protein n=1 Tax=Streptomyces sp. NPDC002564 TaxID=3364649 RepID=UPI00369785E9